MDDLKKKHPKADGKNKISGKVEPKDMTRPKTMSMAMPASDGYPTKDLNSKKGEPILKLEINLKKPRTRTELYTELVKDDKKNLDEDYYEFPHFVIRGVALMFDLIFAYGLVQVTIFFSPYLQNTLINFLNHYKLELWIDQALSFNILFYVEVFLFFFFFVVVPVAFFNASLGKSLTKIRVRGDFKYTISLGQSLRRELIYKPLSIIVLIGFILPFFDKKKNLYTISFLALSW